jgi:DNA-binding NtrC family response regulator
MKRILSVDDSRTSRMIVADVVKKLGFEVVDAVDGVDGLNQLTSDQFDLVILDINMPNLNGTEMLEGMRMQSDKTPVVISTCEVKDATMAFLKKMGIDDLLLKPYKAEDLRAMILRVLKVPDPNQAAAEITAAMAKPAEIMVLSDMEVIHQKLRELIPHELEIDGCRKATDCVLACRKRNYRVIFFDSGITESNLTALWDQLRTVHPRAVYVGMAMHNDGDMEAELRRMGFDEILLRPFEGGRVRTLVDQGCGHFKQTVVVDKNVFRIVPLMVARKRFDEYYDFVKHRCGDLLRQTAEACDSLVILDLSLLSDLDAPWVARLMGEVRQLGQDLEVELWAVAPRSVVSAVPCQALRCFASLQEARSAESAR